MQKYGIFTKYLPLRLKYYDEKMGAKTEIFIRE
jgi:hypothetical protein